nr:L-idonate 5-dehydrogenase [uncultured Cohaesibacter sp.]
MHGVIIHAPKDLRIEPIEVRDPGPHEVRVRIECGGICGSDLHYYHNGGFGTVRIKEPMALGHETAGTIDAVGSEVCHLETGMRVALNPSQPCGTCKFCRKGQSTHCLNMHYFGSAMRFPHAQGMFRQMLVVKENQVFQIPDSMSMSEAANAEPLSVALHAIRQAGSLVGQKVLITGCGPIGALVVIAARYAGASEIVVTDVSDFPLTIAHKAGASTTINVAAHPEELAHYSADKGYFDVLFEASGNEAAFRSAVETVCPGGRVIQLGLGGEMGIVMNTIVTKELQLLGSFRFDAEFGYAVDLMSKKLIDVSPVITAALPFQQAVEAFDLAGDRARAMKVQLTFD